ncbi:MAG TPA: hypothetical protein VFP96_09035 [Candidatus Acidoferrum sp.]|nr:hypothetical protein [Candidatus Acidoferrum sp.]
MILGALDDFGPWKSDPASSSAGLWRFVFPRRTLTRVQIGISAQVRRLRLASEIEVAKTDHRHSEKHRAKHETNSRLAPCLRVERAAPFENNVHDRLSETDVRLLHQLAFDRLLHLV